MSTTFSFSRMGLLTLILLTGFAAQAHKPVAPAQTEAVAEADTDEELSPFDLTRRFTVKVGNQQANIFSGHSNGNSHGTGFFVGIKKSQDGTEYGIIFTNKHVVDRITNVMAQKLTLSFTTNTDIPETVDAKVEFISPVNDFAVVLFKMNDLKRVRADISPALLPEPNSPLYDFAKNGRQLQGRRTMAQGNPFDSQASTTFGQISSVYRDRSQGVFIQTQTPINPGNSGGPLIDLETGVVIGINTQKINEADNIGFSIPIGVVMREYEEWMQDSNLSRPKDLNVRWGINPKSQLDVLGISSIITKAYPDFFNHTEEVIRVHDADPNTNLRVGDQIIKINGHFLISSLLIYDLINRVQRSHGHINMELIRNGQLITVDVPVHDEGYQRRRREVDFVYISGLFFSSVSRSNQWKMDHNLKTSVILGQIVDNDEVNFGSMRMPDQYSVLVSVNINNQDYEIKTLAQLRNILYNHRDAKFIRLDVREPVSIFDPEDGHQGVVIDPAVNVIAYRSTTASYVVPLLEVLGPMQFSLNRFRNQFSFSQGKPETRDWHKAVRADRRPSFCDEVLDKPTPVVKEARVSRARPTHDGFGKPRRLPPRKD